MQRGHARRSGRIGSQERQLMIGRIFRRPFGSTTDSWKTLVLRLADPGALMRRRYLEIIIHSN